MSKIIYIAGYGRSGSTLLDVCLSQHNNVCGLGEITNIFSEWEETKQIEFWKSICSDFEKLYHINDIISFARINADVQTLPSYLLKSDDKEKYKQIWTDLLALVQTKKPSILIDSSKTTRKSLYRAKRLNTIGNDVQIIYLKRNFKSVLKSIKKGSNKDLEKNKKSNIKIVFLRFLIGYGYTYLTSKLVYGFKLHKVEYEEFIKKPSETLNTIMKIAKVDGVSYDTISFVEMDSGIGISGNRMRRSQKITLKG